MAERRMPFNVSELKRIAAKALNKPVEDVKMFRKIAEGGFNRILEVTMNDGASILARLPYPLTVPQRLAVASEVATLNLLRANGIPVPRVLAYSTGKNAVSAEYMLMEKMPGKPLSSIWVHLADDERFKILHQIVTMEAKLFAMELPASGSIYYSYDLPPTRRFPARSSQRGKIRAQRFVSGTGHHRLSFPNRQPSLALRTNVILVPCLSARSAETVS
jgi:hypothetical protein